MLHIPSIMHNSFEVYASIGITDSQRKTHQTETEQRTQKPNRPKKKRRIPVLSIKKSFQRENKNRTMYRKEGSPESANQKKMATYLVETLHNTILINTGTTGTTGRHLAKSEHRLDNAQLGGCGVQSGNGEPVVDDHSGADDGGSAVHTAGHEGNLQEGGELVLVAD